MLQPDLRMRQDALTSKPDMPDRREFLIRSMEPGNAGLSNFGHQVVERLNAERLVIDLSHGSQRTTLEAIRASTTPVLIGHTGCRALADLPRNVGDAELRALADKGRGRNHLLALPQCGYPTDGDRCHSSH